MKVIMHRDDRAALSAIVERRGDILLTRPQAAAERWRTLLALHGVGAQLLPVLTLAACPEIDSLDIASPEIGMLVQPRWAGIIFTSAAALTYLPYAVLPADWALLPCYCVGEQTAALAHRAGWQNIIIGAGDATQLAVRIAAQAPPHSRLLHPAGVVHRPELAAHLHAAGYQVRHWPIYQATPATCVPNACVAALQAERIRGVALFSPRSASIFVALLHAAGLSAVCAKMTAYCLSPAVAASAAALPWQRQRIATAPQSAALLEDILQDYRQSAA
jgi:uroporphyrinogen-III synthase